MIKLYYASTPNVLKVAIALEETGLATERIPVDLTKGEQFDPAFLAISPNNRVPAIVDTTPLDGGAPISLCESGAILLYIADKTQKLVPADARGKAAVTQWLMWQMSAQGPTLGQLGHFRHYAPEKTPYVLQRFTNEARRLNSLLDKQLADHAYLAGEYSIADIICWPWIVFREHHGIDLDDYPHLSRWYWAIDSRPAVRKALNGVVIPKPGILSDAAKKILFNIK